MIVDELVIKNYGIEGYIVSEPDFQAVKGYFMYQVVCLSPRYSPLTRQVFRNF